MADNTMALVNMNKSAINYSTKSAREEIQRKKLLREKGLEGDVSKVLEDIEAELKKVKYAFRAFSVVGNYQDEVIKTLEYFPSLRLASVSLLSHLPKIDGKYELYTFRKNYDMNRMGKK